MIDIHELRIEEYNNRGDTMIIHYDFFTSPFGTYLLGTTGGSICTLTFWDDNQEQAAIEDLRKRWPRSVLERSPAHTEKKGIIISQMMTSPTHTAFQGNILLKGTEFQLTLWRALLDIPPGTLVSYTAIAKSIGRPASMRAAANAIGANPISFLVPCHRVVRENGELGGYRWGIERKKKMIRLETGSPD